MNEAVPAIELVDVCYSYRTESSSFDALRNVNASFSDATSTAILGRSGSGKSTLVSIIALLRRPTAGCVRVGGCDVTALSEPDLAGMRSRELGIVFQSFHLDPAASALDNAVLPSYFRKDMSRRKARALAQKNLDLLGIGDLCDRRPGEMSGGQRQRVAIARALLGSPRVLIADEPTGNLDEDTASVVADQLFSLPRELGTTLIMVTHDREIASRAGRQLSLVGGTFTDAEVAAS